MPIYEYKCSRCGAEFEKLVLKVGGAIEITCKNCGSPEVAEKVSTFASVGANSSGKASSCAPGGA
jgi:putative FmdB family regulatory protein